MYDKLLKPRQSFLITLYIVPSIILALTDEGLVKSRGMFCRFFASRRHCVRRVFIDSLERLMLISKGFIIIIITDLNTVLKMFNP